MSRARICIDYHDRVESIHLAEDAQIYRAGRRLLKYYNNLKTIEKLLNIGHIAELSDSVERTERSRRGYNKNRFNKSDSYCFPELMAFFARDSFRAHIERNSDEYIYMWTNNKWYVAHNIHNCMLIPLTTDLMSGERY